MYITSFYGGFAWNCFWPPRIIVKVIVTKKNKKMSWVDCYSRNEILLSNLVYSKLMWTSHLGLLFGLLGSRSLLLSFVSSYNFIFYIAHDYKLNTASFCIPTRAKLFSMVVIENLVSWHFHVSSWIFISLALCLPPWLCRSPLVVCVINVIIFV